MFTNIGGKIRVLAMVLCWIGIIAFVIIGISMLSNAANLEKELEEAERLSRGSYYRSTNLSSSIDSSSISTIRTTAWILLIVGPLVSWISSFVLYGFGELIERTSDIDATVKSLKSAYMAPSGTRTPQSRDQF